MSSIWPYLAAIVPTIVVATMFYFLIKSMLEGDRRERLAQNRFEAELDRAGRSDANSSSDSEPPHKAPGTTPGTPSTSGDDTP